MFEFSWQVKNASSPVETTIFFLLACFLPKTVAVRSLSVAPSSRSRSIDTKTDPAPDASRTRIVRSRPNTAPSHESSCDLRTRTARRSVDSDPASVLLPPSARRILCACLPAPYTRTPSRDEWPTSSQRFQHPRDVISFQSFDSIAIRCHQRYQRLRPFLGAVGHDLYQLKCRVLFGTQSTPPPAQRPTAHPELRCNRLSTRAPLHPLPKVGYRLRSQTP